MWVSGRPAGGLVWRRLGEFGTSFKKSRDGRGTQWSQRQAIMRESYWRFIFIHVKTNPINNKGVSSPSLRACKQRLGELGWVFLNAQSCSWSQKSSASAQILHGPCFAQSRSQTLPPNPLPVSSLLPGWPLGCFLSPRHTPLKGPLLWLISLLGFRSQTFLWPTFIQPPDMYVTTCPCTP